jgi:anti-anti-sigma factor
MARVTRDQNVTVVETDGNYPSLEAMKLEEFGGMLLSEASHAEPPLLVLDLTATGFIGSSFIELLIRALKRIRERGGSFVLCGLQPFCLDILQTARLDQVFPRYSTREMAIAAITAVSTPDTP